MQCEKEREREKRRWWGPDLWTFIEKFERIPWSSTWIKILFYLPVWFFKRHGIGRVGRNWRWGREINIRMYYMKKCYFQHNSKWNARIYGSRLSLDWDNFSCFAGAEKLAVFFFNKTWTSWKYYWDYFFGSAQELW